MSRDRWTQQQLDRHLANKRVSELDALEMPASKAVEEERDLQRQCENWLNDQGIWWDHDPDSRGKRPGIPDLKICYQGAFVVAELKSRTGKVKPDQQKEMAVIRKNKGRTFIARSLDEFIYKLTNEINEDRPR